MQHGLETSHNRLLYSFFFVIVYVLVIFRYNHYVVCVSFNVSFEIELN